MRNFDFQKVLRDELRELKPYSPDTGKYEVRLDANEAPPFLSVEAKKRLAEVSAKAALERYPSSTHKALKKVLAGRMGIGVDQIICGVGSDELITLLLTVATRLKDRAPAPTVLTPTPTFVMYRLSARIRGMRVMEVPLDESWDLDLASMLRAIEVSDPNLIFLASPNNPTGTMVSADRLEAICEAASNSIVVVDEAYVDYADRDQSALLNKFENVVILRTLSKIGFAALRVGWLAGSAKLVAELEKARLPYNLPTLSQTLATCAVKEFSDEIAEVCEFVKSERTRLSEELAQLKGVEVIPSQANFLWLELTQASSTVHEKLKKAGILVRSFHGRGGRLEQCIRVTIGTQEENDRFLAAMKDA